MKRFAKSVLAVAVSIACCVVTAQENSPPDRDTNEFEEIIVTAQKIEQSLQDTKESIVVYTNKVLEERNLNVLTDVFEQTPGVSGDRFGFRIRGIRDGDGGNQPNRADMASVILDGVTSSGWIKQTTGELWDIEQVEVLRGSQSTNIGRNSLAGAVVVNTNNPVFANEGKVRVGFGEYGKSEIKGVANFNVIDNKSAIRIAAQVNKTDGFVNNITRGEDDYGGSENSLFRVKWLYKPSDDLSVLFSYQHIKDELGNTSIILGDYTREDRVLLADGDAIFDTKADMLSLKLNYNINANWDLTSITAWQDGERFLLNDMDQTAMPLGNGGGTMRRNDEDNNWSQEFRFNYNADNIRGSSGIFISKIEGNRSQNNVTDLPLSTLFDDYLPGAGPALTTTALLPVAIYEPFYDTIQSGDTNVATSSWAVFSEWEYNLSDKWSLNAGVRFDNEEQDFSTATSTTSNYVLPQMGGPFGAIDLGGLTVDYAIGLINSQLAAFASAVPKTQKAEDFSNFLPHAGVTYYWNDDVSTSFFVKKSYRSGGSELTLLNGVNNFEAEELWNYEASLRAVVLGGKGVLNANVYYADWEDQQVKVQEAGTTNTAFQITINAGSSELYGAEVSFNYYMSDALSFYTGVAISKTEYKEFVSADGSEDYSGNDFKFAPEGTGSVGLNYDHESGFFLNAALTYTGSSFSTVKNDREMSSYTLVNANAGYEIQDLKFEAYVTNLTDKTYDTNNDMRTYDGTPGTRLGAPRKFGARVTYSF
jgi:outer membrane receptor protein involved in Fe transport